MQATSEMEKLEDPENPDSWRQEDSALKVDFGTNPDPYRYLGAKVSDRIIVTNLPQLLWWIREIEETLEQEGVKFAPYPIQTPGEKTPSPWPGTKPQRDKD